MILSDIAWFSQHSSVQNFLLDWRLVETSGMAFSWKNPEDFTG
jgi:hypothetical protein